jgi:hypothetical protein
MSTANAGNMGDSLLELDLPLEMKTRFQEGYSKQPQVQVQEDGSCSLCGAQVHYRHEQRHIYWHRNVSCRIWMFGEFVGTHIAQHRQEGDALLALVGSALGLIDPERAEEAELHEH